MVKWQALLVMKVCYCAYQRNKIRN